jgi:hypothetical protein
MHEKLIKYSSLFITVFFLLGCSEAERRIDVDGFSVHVVDRMTQKPIEGALVIASFIARSGSHSSTVGLSNGLETLTGKNGMAHFPAWSTTGPGFGANDPVLVAYKTGYMTVNSSTKSVRKRNGSIFHVTNISSLSFTALPLTKCEDAKFETREECDSRAYGDLMFYIGPTKKNLTKLPVLSKVIEENR